MNHRSQKPSNYERIVPEVATRLRQHFEELDAKLSVAWHDADKALLEMNQKLPKSRSKISHVQMLSAYSSVWQYFDSELRAVLYLSLVDGELNRDSITKYLNDAADLESTAIDNYIAAFPETMFSHHCDLDWYSGSDEKPTRRTLDKFNAMAVLPDLVYFVVASWKNDITSGSESIYVTTRSGKMRRLDTWDYEECLEYDSDGHCYYIQ